MVRNAVGLGMCCLLTLAWGCSGEIVKTVEVSGELKVGGKAIDNAEVHFVHPKFKGFATTDAQGKFKINAAPGENKVYFSKIQGAVSNDPALDPGQMMAAAQGAADPTSAGGAPTIQGQLIPTKYTRYETTDQKFNVPEAGSTSANFDLQP